MDRRRELKQQYKQAKPEMGLFIVRCRHNDKLFIQPTNDLRTVKNGLLVRLKSNMHPNRELQQEYNAFGSEGFTMEVLETLAYSDDAGKTDYYEDLAVLQAMWEQELTAQGKILYRKRLT